MRTPALVSRIHDGQWLPTSIPAGGDIELVAGPAERDRLVDVLPEGNAVILFSTEIRERGEPLAAKS